MKQLLNNKLAWCNCNNAIFSGGLPISSPPSCTSSATIIWELLEPSSSLRHAAWPEWSSSRSSSEKRRTKLWHKFKLSTRLNNWLISLRFCVLFIHFLRFAVMILFGELNSDWSCASQSPRIKQKSFYSNDLVFWIKLLYRNFVFKLPKERKSVFWI